MTTQSGFDLSIKGGSEQESLSGKDLDLEAQYSFSCNQETPETLFFTWDCRFGKEGI